MKSFIYYYTQKIQIPIENFFIGIRNIFAWLPIIWKDRNWDQYFIMNILLFKLKRTQRFMLDTECPPDNITLSSISRCIELLEKVHNEWESYEEPAYRKHEEKWGKSDFYREPTDSNTYILKDRNEERYTEEELKQKRHEAFLMVRIAQRKRQMDFTEAMELFVENFDRWWT